jgi:senataxin
MANCRYFGAFTDDVLDGFYRSFDAWELEIVVHSLSRAGISLQESVTQPKNLAYAPSVNVYHIVSNLSILEDAKILSFIRRRPPFDPFPDWPPDPPPVGLLILMMDENPEVRAWAKTQCSKSQIVPIPLDKFNKPYKASVEAIANALISAGPEPRQMPPFTSGVANLNAAASNIFSFPSNPGDLWSAFGSVLRFIPPEVLTSSRNYHVDIRRIVAGHLHDVGPRQLFCFYPVLALL